jgi:hypothetical protein
MTDDVPDDERGEVSYLRRELEQLSASFGLTV